MVQVQPWILNGKHSIICLRLFVDTVHPWTFRDTYGQIDVFMDDGFSLILFIGNFSKLGHSMHEMFFWQQRKLILVLFNSY